MEQRISLGVIGLGNRGSYLLQNVLLPMKKFRVAAVCDLYQDRAEKAADLVERQTGERPLLAVDYQELLACKELEAVLISASWEAHVPAALAAMRAGKAVACEVGGAASVEECWELVRTYEQTGTPIMLLENCCYGRDELMVLHMVREGVFGELVHCEGGYRHDLRSEVAFGRENRHYRLAHYLMRNCENYPTHELGPIAKLLSIGRGNRMLTVSSTASKSAGMHHYLKENKGERDALSHAHFAQGDVVTTVIRCAQGQTITLTLDTTLPRYYSRGLHVQGTKAMFTEENRSLFIDGEHNGDEFCWQKQWNNIEQYRGQYEHRIWRRYLEEGVQEGHDGIDWLVLSAFAECVRNGTPAPIDVYDMAAWMSVTALSEQSIALGGQPLAMPDFTCGRWLRPTPESGSWFSLERD